eukprot:gene33108-40050_t
MEERNCFTTITADNEDGDGRRPDLTVSNFKNAANKDLLLDICVTQSYPGSQRCSLPNAFSRTQASSVKDTHPEANQAYQKKINKYSEVAQRNNYLFQPIIFEANGFIHPQSLQYLKDLATLCSTRFNRSATAVLSYFRNQLSVTLNISLAKSIQRRSIELITPTTRRHQNLTEEYRLGSNFSYVDSGDSADHERLRPVPKKRSLATSDDLAIRSVPSSTLPSVPPVTSFSSTARITRSNTAPSTLVVAPAVAPISYADSNFGDKIQPPRVGLRKRTRDSEENLAAEPSDKTFTSSSLLSDAPPTSRLAVDLLFSRNAPNTSLADDAVLPSSTLAPKPLIDSSSNTSVAANFPPALSSSSSVLITTSSLLIIAPISIPAADATPSSSIVAAAAVPPSCDPFPRPAADHHLPTSSTLSPYDILPPSPTTTAARSSTTTSSSTTTTPTASTTLIPSSSNTHRRISRQQLPNNSASFSSSTFSVPPTSSLPPPPFPRIVPRPPTTSSPATPRPSPYRRNFVPTLASTTPLLQIPTQRIGTLIGLVHSVKNLPHQLLPNIRNIFCMYYDKVVQSPDDSSLWRKVFLLPLVLFTVPPRQSFTLTLKQRLKLLQRDDWSTFTLGFISTHLPPLTTTNAATTSTIIQPHSSSIPRRVATCIKEGNFSKAASIILDRTPPTTLSSEQVFQKLQDKNPNRNDSHFSAAAIQELLTPLVHDANNSDHLLPELHYETLFNIIKGKDRGKSAGLDKLRFEHLQDLLGTNFRNGHIRADMRRFDCQILALPKTQTDVRPIGLTDSGICSILSSEGSIQGDAA